MLEYDARRGFGCDFMEIRRLASFLTGVTKNSLLGTQQLQELNAYLSESVMCQCTFSQNRMWRVIDSSQLARAVRGHSDGLYRN